MDYYQITTQTTPLIDDINYIIKPPKEKYEPLFYFEVKLHTEYKDLDYTDGVFLVDINIIRDLENNISDYIEASISIPFGTFVHEVYDYLDNVEITIIHTKQLYKNRQPVEHKERYKAVYLIDKNPKLPNLTNYNKIDLNNQMPLTITFQLLDRSVETLRIKTLSGIFDKTINKNKSNSIDTFLRSIISEQANKILIENKHPLDNIFIEKPDNTIELGSIVIPSYTRLVEIPKYIQDKNIGIYHGNVGIYISNFNLDYEKTVKTLFIYSLHNSRKYLVSEYKLIFYSPISSEFSLHDITYRYEDKTLKVISTNITNIEDNKESYIMSYGSGIRISNTNSFMKKPVEIKNGIAEIKRNNLSTEIVFKNRKDNLNFAVNKGITQNIFKHTSSIMKNNGNIVRFTVYNVDPYFLLPCYKCKIVYMNKKNKIDEIYGVLNRLYISFTSNELNIPLQTNVRKRALACVTNIEVFVNSY